MHAFMRYNSEKMDSCRCMWTSWLHDVTFTYRHRPIFARSVYVCAGCTECSAL